MNKNKLKTAELAEYKGEIPNTPLRFLWYVTKPSKWYAIIGLTIVILTATADTLSVLIIQKVIRAAEEGSVDVVFLYGVLYPIILLLIQMSWRITGLLGRVWAINAQKLAADVLFEYATKHSHSYFVDRFAGSLMSKIGNVIGAMERLIVDILWHHTERFVSFIIGCAIIYAADFWSGVSFTALLVVLVVTNYFFVPRKQTLSLALAESRTRLRGRMVDVFSNISAARQYSRIHDESAGLDEYTSDTRERQSVSWLYTEYMMFVNSLILSIFAISMFVHLSGLWVDGVVDTATFVTIMLLIFTLSNSMIFIGRAFNDTATSYGEAAEGLSEIVVEHDIKDAESSVALNVKEASVDWKNVSFYYNDKKIFDDFSLTIPAGQRVGLVGPSGAGKTTFVSLLLRQHDINQGAIMIDGQNIAEVTQDSLRENIAVVPQEPILFHRSIHENIAYGNPSATIEDIIEVAKKGQAHEFITLLSEGYDTMVGERGVKLSGGQKQRVAIARAMLKNAPILVLDEATSALDSESEVSIQKALHELMVGKTVVAIAHRLSTLREMDRIIVLENGKVVEDGTHESLVSSGGTYARLWTHQAGGFLQE